VSSIISTIQSIIRQELSRVRVADLGVVEAVHPHKAGDDIDNYGCDVRLKNSGLLLKRVPVATNHIGTVAIPNIGDLVLLVYEQGDVNQPIIMARLYNESDRPPLNNPNEIISHLPLAAPDNKAIRTAIRNIGENSPREMIIEMPPKITVQINDGTVRVTAGKTEMKLDQPGGSGGTVTVMAGSTKITMNQDGDVTVEAEGAMALKAKGDLSIEGKNVSVKGLNVSIEATSEATLKATTSATVNGGLSSTVQGASLSLKGITSFSPS
jgi:phage baseplate assembly protein gpV